MKENGIYCMKVNSRLDCFYAGQKSSPICGENKGHAVTNEKNKRIGIAPTLLTCRILFLAVL